MFRNTLAIVFAGVMVSSANAQITASVDILQNGSTPAFFVIDEGDSERYQYSYLLTVDDTQNRFRADGFPFPPDVTVVLPNGSNPTFNVQDNVRTSSGGGSFTFEPRDEGNFVARVFGDVDLETGFDTFVGNFSFNEISFSTIRVENVDPTFDQLIPDSQVFVNESFFLAMSASDPGLDDVLTFDWDYDSDGQVDFSSSSADRISATPDLFATGPGVFNVTVGVDDGDGGSDMHSFTITAIEPTPSGEFDLDGDIDGADFLQWQRGNSPVPFSAADLMDWETNYGIGPSSLPSLLVVPEPSTITSSVLAAVVVMIPGCHALSRVRSE